MKQGLLILLSGPSGVGKGTLRKFLLKDGTLDAVYSVSMTTRIRKMREIEGKDYFFVTEEEFKKLVKEDKMIEYVLHNGAYYGTPKEFVERNLKVGNNVLLEIEAEGALQVMKKYSGMYILTIFLMPPSLETMEQRLRKHHFLTNEEMDAILTRAQKEMAYKDLFDVCLTNYTLAKTAKRFNQSVTNRLNYIEAIEEGKEPPEGYILKRP